MRGAPDPQKLYQQVARSIAASIAEGRYVPGDRLPSERDLARRLEVGRASVREAIASLQVAGMIETRPGAGSFVAAGAAAIERFVWVFFLFGAFLVYTAVKLATGHEEQEEGSPDSWAVRLMERLLPTTREYDGERVVTRVDGRRVFTPMLLVMVAIGSTDLLFALDSIPAIFGLTEQAYIVFTANAFALMGLRQLYFLLDGLLDRLVHLSYGLAVILGFIGVKLVLHALHDYDVSWAPDIGIVPSLGVIIGTLAVVTVTSLRSTRR